VQSPKATGWPAGRRGGARHRAAGTAAGQPASWLSVDLHPTLQPFRPRRGPARAGCRSAGASWPPRMAAAGAAPKRPGPGSGRPGGRTARSHSDGKELRNLGQRHPGLGNHPGSLPVYRCGCAPLAAQGFAVSSGRQHWCWRAPFRARIRSSTDPDNTCALSQAGPRPRGAYTGAARFRAGSVRSGAEPGSPTTASLRIRPGRRWEIRRRSRELQ